jgi:hypothetical protein
VVGGRAGGNQGCTCTRAGVGAAVQARSCCALPAASLCARAGECLADKGCAAHRVTVVAPLCMMCLVLLLAAASHTPHNWTVEQSVPSLPAPHNVPSPAPGIVASFRMVNFSHLGQEEEEEEGSGSDGEEGSQQQHANKGSSQEAGGSLSGQGAGASPRGLRLGMSWVLPGGGQVGVPGSVQRGQHCVPFFWREDGNPCFPSTVTWTAQ